MTGPGIRIYTDEDVDADLSVQLRSRGCDAISSVEAGNSNREVSDEEQLQYATGVGRAIVVHNARHFVPLHERWISRGDEHYGIIVVPQNVRLPELFRRIWHHLDTVTPEEQYNNLLWS